MTELLDLLDYRRRVESIYQAVRAGQGHQAWLDWREGRNRLFATHPQSPLDDRDGFAGLPYFDYDESWRTVAVLVPGEDTERPVTHNGSGVTSFRSVGTLHFSVHGNEGALEALWLDSYGGGLFLPFRDATNGVSTYGGGRYLLDTVKGADLGHTGNEVVLDFNYSYHPSCVHSHRWSCPLAPTGNRLAFEVDAGERLNEAPEDR